MECGGLPPPSAAAYSALSDQRKAAASRYYVKYEALFRLLQGQPIGELTVSDSDDLLLPNTYQREPSEEIVCRMLTANQRAAFLASRHRAVERVHDLIDRAPTQACRLASTLIDEAKDSELSKVGISMLEELGTFREAEVHDYVLEHVRGSRRFRVALSHAYLNPSERFLDELTEAARTPLDVA